MQARSSDVSRSRHVPSHGFRPSEACLRPSTARAQIELPDRAAKIQSGGNHLCGAGLFRYPDRGFSCMRRSSARAYRLIPEAWIEPVELAKQRGPFEIERLQRIAL